MVSRPSAKGSADAASTAHFPVPAPTAAAMQGDAARMPEAGGDAYIAKPMNTRTLSAQNLRALPALMPKAPAS